MSKTIVIAPMKSTGVSLILTFFLGCFGLLYTSVTAFIIMFIVEGILAFFTLGFSLFLTHPICMIWGLISVKRYNRKLASGIR
ncbi:hypothetical protein [Risungbinella massiliensis]|uniref:hypothetical protein n=1 Tax=Risungbinella massiliensis TaxID=1329796 RepID=UPI0005CC38BD|nr:hypothetical protein [Risungbinella massiliensis]